MLSSSQSWSAPSMCFFGSPLIVLHSGLSDLPEERQASYRKRCLGRLQELAAPLQALLKKNPRIEAQELTQQAIQALENEEMFNAGYGSKLQADGKARLSCSFMDGANQKASGVVNIEGFKNPSSIAAQLQNEVDRFLVGNFAAGYGLSQKIEPHSPVTKKRIEQWKKKTEGKTGTVGCVVLDQNEQCFASTSTGGRGLEKPGRMSDSCTVAGNFATPFGAASCTGNGEEIIDAGLAVAIVSRLEDHMNLQEAVSRAFLRQTRKNFGMIALDKKGNAIVHATNGQMGFAIISPKMVWTGFDSKDWNQIQLESY